MALTYKIFFSSWSKHKNIFIYKKNDYKLHISFCSTLTFPIAIIPIYCTNVRRSTKSFFVRALHMWCLRIQLIQTWRRAHSIADAICIVLFTHFNDAVGDVMSMIKVVAGCWRQSQRIVAVEHRRWRRRRWWCLTAIHTLLKLIDTQIIIVMMMLLMMTVCWCTAAIGLCGPSFRYSWSFCVRWVGRVVVGKMR